MVSFREKVDKFRKIFSRLPEGEKKMPIVKVDDKIMTWEEAYDEIIKETEKSKLILKKLEEMGIL